MGRSHLKLEKRGVISGIVSSHGGDRNATIGANKKNLLHYDKIDDVG